MRALVFDAPSADGRATRVAEVPDPSPARGEVAVDVQWAGLNFADVMLRRSDPGHAISYPVVPGIEGAGTVRALGSDVRSLKIGDRVTAFFAASRGGGLAEVAIASSSLVVPVPDSIELRVAAVAPVALTTALLLLDDAARLRAGEIVLVHSAAGGVGHAAAQVARLRGVGQLIGVVGSTARIGAARAAGYDVVLVRGDGLADAVRQVIDGHGVDVVLDPQGTTQLETDLAAAAPGARIILFGNATGALPDPLPGLGQLMAGNVSVGGFSLSALSACAPERVHAAIHSILEMLSNGALTIDVTAVAGLESASEALQELAQGTGPGKLAVKVRP